MNDPHPDIDPFSPARDQDAWFVIRGFAYQIDATILRWLNLGPAETLELERGEDIDRLVPAAAEGRARILEQVKHLEASVTLRTPAAVKAIVDFIDHRDANPSVDLRFQFTSCAAAGVERSQQKRGGSGGIAIWERLRRLDPCDALARTTDINTIRAILRSLRRGKLPKEPWSRFFRFVLNAPQDAFLDVVQHFEWSLGAPEVDDLRHRIRGFLRSRGANESEVAGQYDRLTAHVLQLLGQRGIKRLRLEDLDEQLAIPLSPADDDRITVLRELVDDLRPRVGRVEQNLACHAERLETLEQAAERRQELGELTSSLLASAGSIGSIEGARVDQRVAPNLTPPPIVTRASPRNEALQAARAIEATWLHVHGPPGIGKSQLVRGLLGDGGCEGWLVLRDLESGEASVQLDAAIEKISGFRGIHSDSLYAEPAAQAGAGVLLVIDDLPRLSREGPLGRRIIRLARVVRDAGGRLITTGAEAVPRTVQQLLDDGTIENHVCPALSPGECGEILAAHGAPDTPARAVLSELVAARARGHATFVAALAQSLRDRGWPSGRDLDEALAGSELAADLKRETRERVRTTVSSETARDLLYRLSQILGSAFDLADADALAAVPPPIARPREHLDELAGLWVQPGPDGAFAVSVLAREIGATALPGEIQRDCHRVLGERILAGGELGPIDVVRCLRYLTNAGELVKAGQVVAMALVSLQSQGATDAAASLGLLGYYETVELPDGLHPDTRVIIRSVQAGMRDEAGLDPTFSLEDLDRLLSDEGVSDWARFTGMVHAHAIAATRDFDRACDYATRALKLLPGVKAQVEAGGPGPFPEPEVRARVRTFDEIPGVLVWSAVGAVASPPSLGPWLQMLDEIGPRARELSLKSSLADTGSILVADRLWMAEAAKPADDRDWDGILDVLHRLEATATRLGMSPLATAAVRGRIVVHAEYLDDLDAALADGNRALASSSSSRRDRFIVGEALARQFLYGKRHAEARERFQGVFGEPVAGLELIRVNGLLSAATASSEDGDPVEAAGYARRAVDLIEGALDRDPSRILAAQARGELALVLQEAGDSAEAFDALDAAAEHLEASPDRGRAWRACVVMLLHVAGLLGEKHRIARGEKPVDWRARGTKPGFFLHAIPSAAARYVEQTSALLPYWLAVIADAFGRTDRIERWANLAFQRSESPPMRSSRLLLVPLLVAPMLRSGRWAEALELVERQVAEIDESASFHGAGGSVAGSETLTRETARVYFGFLPAVFELCRAATHDRDAGRGAAKTLIEFCRRWSRLPDAREPWDAKIAMLETSFLESGRRPAVRRIAARVGNSESAVALGWACSALCADADPLEVMSDLAALTLAFVERLGALSPGFERLVVEHLIVSATSLVERHRARFRDADDLLLRISSSGSGCSAERARAVLDQLRDRIV